jgi:hypothetical protein
MHKHHPQPFKQQVGAVRAAGVMWLAFATGCCSWYRLVLHAAVLPCKQRAGAASAARQFTLLCNACLCCDMVFQQLAVLVSVLQARCC